MRRRYNSAYSSPPVSHRHVCLCLNLVPTVFAYKTVRYSLRPINISMVVRDWEKTTAVDTTIAAVGKAARRLMRGGCGTSKRAPKFVDVVSACSTSRIS